MGGGADEPAERLHALAAAANDSGGGRGRQHTWSDGIIKGVGFRVKGLGFRA